MEYQDEYLYDEDGWTCPECGSINSLEEGSCIYCDDTYDWLFLNEEILAKHWNL